MVIEIRVRVWEEEEVEEGWKRGPSKRWGWGAVSVLFVLER